MKGKISFISLFALLVLVWGGLSAPVALAEKPIKIALLCPMEFMQGKHMWWGAEMAAEEINAQGGIQFGETKRPIELIKVESNEFNSVPDAAMAMERAISRNRADVILGGYRSEAIMAMQDVASQYEKIFMHGGSHPELTKRLEKNWDKYKYCFHTHTPTTIGAIHGNASFQEFIDRLKEVTDIEKPKVALVLEKVMWTEPYKEWVPQWVEEAGGEIVGIWQLSTTASDVSSELTAIRRKGANVIYTVFGGPVGVTFQKQWMDLKIPAAQTGANVQGMSTEFQEATGGKAEYLMTWAALARAPLTEKTIPFWDKYVERNGTTPLHDGVDMYEAVYIVADAIQRCGGVEDTEALIAALENTDLMLPLGRSMFYDKDMNLPPNAPEDKVGTKDVFYPHDRAFGPGFMTTTYLQWQDGEPVPVWPSDWHGISYPNVKKIKIAPWVKEYWRKQ